MLLSTIAAAVALVRYVRARSSLAFKILMVSAVAAGISFGSLYLRASRIDRILFLIVGVATLLTLLALAVWAHLEWGTTQYDFGRAAMPAQPPRSGSLVAQASPRPAPGTGTQTPCPPTAAVPPAPLPEEGALSFEKVTFAELAGCEEAVAQLRRLLDQAREPKLYRQFGANPVRGILLYGPPGTGKTALARATATECGAGFHFANCSEFVNRYVGVGASNVRELVGRAVRARAATGKLQIVFLDEIDSVGEKRQTSTSGGSREYVQTLNQLLAELDGFQAPEGLVFIAATNRLDVLDPALLRPGRFDRKVKVDLPDQYARERIFAIHMKSRPAASDVSLHVLAAMTDGASGADIKNICNEAANLAAERFRRNGNWRAPKQIAHEDLVIAVLELFK
jgi:hypothetical protein